MVELKKRENIGGGLGKTDTKYRKLMSNMTNPCCKAVMFGL